MLRFLDQSELWPTLKKLARNCRRQKFIAVAYVGKGSRKSLPLGRGDVLLCAMTEANVRNGSVCPDEIAALQKRGVSVYVRDDLHAKVYLFGTRAVVGSPNLSQSSCENLDEAALFTSDQKVVADIRRWFHERLGEPVTPEWLAYCKRVYRPPKRGPHAIRVGKQKPARAMQGKRVWLVGIEDADFPETELTAWAKGEAEAVQHRTRGRSYEVESIRWSGRSRLLKYARRGDIVIQIYNDDSKSLSVCPHGRLLNLKPTKSRLGTPIKYLYVEMPASYRKITWKQLQVTCRKMGLKLGRKVVECELRDVVQANRVLSVLSPEVLARHKGR